MPLLRLVILVRHGHAERESPHGLTPVGFAQATCLAARLASMKHPPTTITSSTMLRAKQTAAVIATALPNAARRPPLASLCEGFPAKPPEAAIPAELRDAEPGFWAKEARRHLRAYHKVTAPSDQPMSVDLVVAHGNVIVAMAMRALGLGPESFYRSGVGNCSVTLIGVNGDERTLLKFNDTGHLPASVVPER